MFYAEMVAQGQRSWPAQPPRRIYLSAKAGQVSYDSALNKARVFNGTAWGSLSTDTQAVATLSATSPNSGPTAGGTTVTITGTDFTGTTDVSFGSTAGTILSVSNTQI
ncbi:MAG: IPT/TIG domain-containing protein, partial [Chloroflexales bacterium]